jgi:hypothetical protein
MFNFDQIRISTWNTVGSKARTWDLALPSTASQQTSTIQIRIGVTGVAMSLPKNCDGLKSPSASRIASRDSFRLVEPQTASFSEINSYGSSASRPIFAEDFTVEHSLPGLRLSPVEILSSF